MLINELAKQCNITKKAVQYYVEQGLLNPVILGNGYREFSEEDREKLEKIVLYRKLDLSISQIKSVLEDSDTIHTILYQRTMDLEKEKAKQEILKKIASGEPVESLGREICHLDSNTMIIQRLMTMFPSYYGKYISLNFSRYLTGKIETKEQMKAFEEIIEFFDNAPDMEFPEDLKQYLDEYLDYYSGEEGRNMLNQMIENKTQAMEDIDAFVAENKEVLDTYYQFRESEEFKQTPGYRLMEIMKEFCQTSGYYDVFIPAMRRLSPLYNEYYEQMLKANERFEKIYFDSYPTE